jgi:glycosyltransferase involved in cell wall biosynthesis
MKICLITNLYKPYARGGAETVVQVVKESLEKRGDEVFIITTKPWLGFKDLIIKRLKDYKIYYINGFYYNLNKIPKFLRLFWHVFDMFDVLSYFRVKNILKKEKPDLVITHCLKGVGFLIPLAIKNLKIKHIHTLHDIQLLHPSGLMFYGKEKILGGLFAKIYQNFCRFLFGSPAVVISPSRWLLNLHAERGFFGNSKMIVMPNPAEFAPTSAAGRKRGDGFKFLYVGQIEEHKGILFLIKAFKLFLENSRDSTPPAPPLAKGGDIIMPELIIAGDGAKFAEAKKLAGENKNIKLLGRKNREEVAELMRGADCLIVPSLCYDNSPMVIYEAFVANLPVIGAEIGGISELLDKNTGFLFKPGDEDDLINKIKQAFSSTEALKSIAQIGRDKVKNFGAEEYANKLVSL